jgi:hypothetical protein
VPKAAPTSFVVDLQNTDTQNFVRITASMQSGDDQEQTQECVAKNTPFPELLKVCSVLNAFDV